MEILHTKYQTLLFHMKEFLCLPIPALLANASSALSEHVYLSRKMLLFQNLQCVPALN
jgi:hypothetical protein